MTITGNCFSGHGNGASEDVAKQRPEKFIVQDSTCLNRGITITGNTFGYCTENAIEINSAKQRN